MELDTIDPSLSRSQSVRRFNIRLSPAEHADLLWLMKELGFTSFSEYFRFLMRMQIQTYRRTGNKNLIEMPSMSYVHPSSVDHPLSPTPADIGR